MRERNLVLLVRGGLGDLICSTPVHLALKSAFPASELWVMAKKGFSPLLSDSPVVDEIIEVKEANLDTLTGFYSLLKKIKSLKFKRAIVLWSKPAEARLCFLAGIPVRVGQADRLAYSFLYTHKVKVASAAGDTEKHWSQIMLDYVRVLGIEPEEPRLLLNLSRQVRDQAAGLLKEAGADPGGVLIGFHPGKGIGFTPERVSVAHFAALADALAEIPGTSLVLTGGENELELVRAVRQKMQKPAIDLSGRTELSTLAGLISHFKALVCPDSGPMHIGAALGVKIAAIFALRSDFPKRWAPLGVPFALLRPQNWNCRGKCVKEKCVYFSCYQEIAPQELKSAVGRLLAL